MFSFVNLLFLKEVPVMERVFTTRPAQILVREFQNLLCSMKQFCTFWRYRPTDSVSLSIKF